MNKYITEKTLILVQTDVSRDVVFEAWRKAGYHSEVIFTPVSKPLRLIRRLWVDHFLPGFSFWFGNWKKQIRNFDTVIVHADVRTRTVPKYIHKKKPSMRIIYWYWNPVNSNSLPELTGDSNIECWSFDSGDCKTFRMKKNIQYYFEIGTGNSDTTDYDLYFVGRDKGRKKALEEMRKVIEREGISCRFDLVNDSDAGIPYSEVQNRIRKSKAVLEINQSGQVGCTLRALESLFLRKKFVTTNGNIVNEDFYNQNNIFIFGKDEVSKLKDFINSSYDNSSDVYIKKHTIDAWFNNFFD